TGMPRPPPERAAPNLWMESGAIAAASVPRGDAQACRVDLGIRVGPGLLEAGLDGRGLGGALLLQTLRQAPERPAVLGPDLQVLAVDPLRLVDAVGGEEDGAERMADGLDPVRGLDVAEVVLELDGPGQLGDRLIDLPLAQGDLA